MNYRDVLAELYALNFRGIQFGLGRVQAAAARLGDPQKLLTAVQVAGTNGKGTVCALLEASCRCAGSTTGLFTSPHLHRFTERIRINGEEISRELVADALGEVLSVTRGKQGIPLTFFEVTTLAALRLFASAQLDVVILETGMGGRLDATTIVPAAVTVITSVGLDHMDYLGTTEADIAREKAGICRKGVPLFLGALSEEALETVCGVARERGSLTRRLGHDFPDDPDFRVPLPGTHQRQNVLLARQLLLESGDLLGVRFCDDHLGEAFERMWLPARFEIVRGPPDWLLDGAHNLEAIVALIEALEMQSLMVDTLLFGALEGKPADNMMALLKPRSQRVIVTAPPVARAFDARLFAERWNTEFTDSVEEAVHRVSEATERQGATDENRIHLVTGSFFLAAEARRILLNEPADPPIAL